MITIDQLRFDNKFTKSLPGDKSFMPGSRATPNVSYSLVKTTPVKNPQILAWSKSAGELLNLSKPARPDGIEAQIFSGNQQTEHMQPFAARYGGHQFGHWAGQLGDGRAISLGEIINSSNQRWEIQLKGAGRTPYSRTGDGRAVLRSSIREFLCSEAMHFLGIPTTRALCCVTTGEGVVRDMFYDGNPQVEPGAVVTRLAPTFIRFGNFEILAASNEETLLKNLADFTIQTHFPEITAGNYSQWLAEIARRTAEMIVDWQRVGFVHGVMNTDNMSILGLTIDYGPYGFLDNFDPNWTPNTTDAEYGRYRFRQQPGIAYWNLNMLAQALALITSDHEGLKTALEVFITTFNEKHTAMKWQKLGLTTSSADNDLEYLEKLDSLLQELEADMTLFFRRLSAFVTDHHGISQSESTAFFVGTFYKNTVDEKLALQLQDWLSEYTLRLKQEPRTPAQIVKAMNQINPYFILRNYISQEVIDQATAGSTEKLEHVLTALQTPYEENSFTKPYHQLRPDWAKSKPGCSALSCSS